MFANTASAKLFIHDAAIFTTKMCMTLRMSKVIITCTAWTINSFGLQDRPNILAAHFIICTAVKKQREC